MKRHAGKWFAGVVVVFLGYFTVLPMFWTEPRVEVACPESIRLGEDLEVTVRVSAPHRLFHVNRVRFVPDPKTTTATARQTPLPPVQVFNTEPKRFGRAQLLQRFTFPARRELRLRTPLAERYGNALAPGQLRGAIQVTLTHASYSLRTIHSRETTAVLPVTVEVASR
jgi:hypothetical protein